MGESIYHLRATFKTVTEAKNASAKLSEMLTQADNAYDFWQANRSPSYPGHPAKYTNPEFWEEFKKQFPLVCEVLSFLPGTNDYNKNPIDGPDHSNSLSGKLGIIGHIDDLTNIVRKKNVLHYSSEVWHMSDWDHFAKWTCQKLGAKECSWESDEGDKGMATL